MENYNLLNYLRKGEYPETINGKTEKANLCRQNFKFENGSLCDYYNYTAPDSDDKMIQCDTCMHATRGIYHFKCVSIKVYLHALKESFCPSCIIIIIIIDP